MNFKSLLGGLGGGISSLLGGGQKNPANAAMPYLNRIPETVKPYYDPYIKRGNEAGEIAANQYNRLSSDPMGYYNEVVSGYKPSSGYKYRAEEGLRNLSNVAATGGHRGTIYDQKAQAELLQKLMAEDEERYVDNIFRTLGIGLSGQEQAMTRGYGASGNLADALGSNLATQGELAFQGQAQKNQQKMELIKLLSQLGGAAAGFAGGGPAGAAAGAGAFGGGNNYSQQYGYGAR